MLWDLIRDFFVEHIFGGTNSNDEVFSVQWGADFQDFTRYDNDMFVYQVGSHWGGGADVIPTYINIGDWLSTTATAIAITIILVMCCMFVYKIVKLIGGLIR